MDEPKKLNARSGKDALREVAEALEDDILFGALRPREHLVEDVLMARFCVKRHVIRSALNELVRMGIVVKNPNKGATVRDFSMREIEEIYELREVLQAHAVRRMKLPADPEVIEKLIEIQTEYDEAFEAKTLRRIGQLNDDFHNAFYAACGNDHLAKAIDHYFYLIRAMRMYPIANPRILSKAKVDHWAMIEGLKSGGREDLVRLCIDHIQDSKNAYLAVGRWS